MTMIVLHSEQLSELVTALAKAQGVFEPAVFNREVSFQNRKYKYADLASVFQAIRKPLASNGLSVTQTIATDAAAEPVLCTTLWHASGQWIRSGYPLAMVGKPQDVGSAITYARRYSLSAMLGIVTEEDDDGEAGERAQKQNGRKPPQAAPSTINPQEVKPPIDPETGELTPHTIQAKSWSEFGQKMIAAIDTTDDELEIDEWVQANAERLDKAAGMDPQPNSYKIITQHILARRATFRHP